MAVRYLVLDVASAAIANASDYIDASGVSAPAHWKDEAKIAEYVKEKTAERILAAGLDLDLARITGIGEAGHDYSQVTLCKTEDQERAELLELAATLTATPDNERTTLITYNGHSFDLPLLMRRARYLGVDFPKLNVDRYKSPHVDLMLELSDRDPSRRRGLGFYAKRLGWTDLLKPLSGAEESRVHETGRWAELEASIAHDVEATRRLAAWLGLL